MNFPRKSVGRTGFCGGRSRWSRPHSRGSRDVLERDGLKLNDVQNWNCEGWNVANVLEVNSLMFMKRGDATIFTLAGCGVLGLNSRCCDTQPLT